MKKTFAVIFTICTTMVLLASCKIWENDPVECEHSYEYTITKEATCTEKGSEKGVCSLCEDEIEREISALGHDMKKVAAKSATCTEDGWNEYEKCSRCDESTFVKVDALGHDLEHFEAKLPTESSVGWNAYDDCRRCDYSTYVEIPMTPVHTHAFGAWETVTEPTCTDVGSKIRYCIDEDCDGEETGVIDPLGHDEENHAEKAATCTEDGYAAYVTCKREGCDYTTYEKINAGHDLESHEAKDATCIEDGYAAYETCKRDGCDYTTYQKIDALGHNEETVALKAPTATDTGWMEHTYCSRCNTKWDYVELSIIGAYYKNDANEAGRVVYENYSSVYKGLDESGDGVINRNGGYVRADDKTKDVPAATLEVIENNKMLAYTSPASTSRSGDHAMSMKPKGNFGIGEIYVFETDIYFSATANEQYSVWTGGGRVFASISLETTNKKEHTSGTRIDAVMETLDGIKGYRFLGERFEMNEWHNIVIEYNKASGTVTTKVDGVPAATYQFAANIDVAYVNFSMNMILAGAYTYLDNTYLGCILSSDEPDTPEEPETNFVFGEGAYYKQGGGVVYENYTAIWNGLGKRNEGDGIVTRPGGIITPDSSIHDKYPNLCISAIENSNKILKYTTAPAGSGEFDKTVLLQPDGGFAKGAKYVFETDIYFSAASSDVGGVQGKTFATISFETDGATASSTSSTRLKTAMINDDLVSYTLFGKNIKADTWYNITIEYDYVSGVASTKINGETAESYELKEKVDVKYIGFSMNNTLKGAYTMLDSTYMGSFGEQPEDTELVGSNDSDSSILPVKGGASGIVVLVHDDGTLSSAQILDALYAKYGLHGDVAMIADRVDPSNFALDNDRLAWQALVETGRWGVLNHSMTHTYWGDASTGVIDNALIKKEVLTSRDILKAAFPTERILIYAYPGMSAVTSTFGNSVYDEVIKVVKKEYLAGRKWYSDGSSEFYNWDWELMPTQGINTNSQSNINLIDRVAANGEFVSILMHKVLEDSDPNANKDTSNVSASVVEALCARIAEYVATGKIWSANYEDAVLYLMEAEKAYLEVTRNETSITATLEDGLDDELYNYPLSVRIGVPENWKTVRYVVSGVEYLTEAKTVDGKKVVEIDILPNGALVTITAAICVEEEALDSEFAEEIAPGVLLDKNYFPGFVRKSVTFTIDDGDIKNDPEFINIVRPAGIVGTFNLKNTDVTTAANYLLLYEGYEVANHSLIHSLPNINGVIDTLIADGKISDDTFNSSTANREYLYKSSYDGVYYIDYYTYIVTGTGNAASWHPIATDEAYMKYATESKENIEAVFGDGSVVGYAYAHGRFTDEIKAALKEAGYLYARATGLLKNTTGFALPDDRYKWIYNADVGCLLDVMEDYAAYADNGELKMFSFGVHAVDFVGKWAELEEFADTYGDRHDEFYYATNRQIFEYEDAVEALVYESGSLINESDINLYVSLNGEKVIIPANSSYKIADGVVAPL